MVEFTTVVETAGLGMRPADGFLVRSRGMLRGWPELAYDVIPLYEDAPDLPARQFIVDLLVSAGTVQAQDVIAQLLQGADEAELPYLLQHIGPLRTPTPQMGQLVLAAHEDAAQRGDDTLRRGSMYVMGALAPKLQSRDPQLADLMVDTLRAELDRANTRDQIAAALGGLGNARREEDVDRFLAWRFHEDAVVRAQVASALQWTDDPRAEDALVHMLGDPEMFAANAAVSVLGFYKQGDAVTERVALTTINGAVNPEVSGLLAGFFAKRGLENDWAREALGILGQRTRDPHERRRIETILGVELDAPYPSPLDSSDILANPKRATSATPT